MFAALLFSSALVALGIGSYFATARVSITALIPAAFGLVAALLTLIGWLAPSLSTAMRHATTGLAVLGFLATMRSLPALLRRLTRSGESSPSALAKGIMSVSCLAFVGFVIFSS
jgi:hypothetical protein